MPKTRLTRRGLLVGAAPLVAAGPLARLVLDGEADAADTGGRSHVHDHHYGATGHAAMLGEGVPAVGGPRDLDELIYPPPAKPYSPGRVSEHSLVAIDRELEIAPGVFFPAWTYNGTVPGPIIRATEGDTLRVHFHN